jgi:predicted exporter/SAM-dependent methyltransferase
MKLFNIPLFIAVFFLILIMTLAAVVRLDFDTDIVRSLPAGSVVVSDALDIFENHPIHEQIAIDISLNVADPEILVECARFVEERLKDSALFKDVGNSKIADLIPDLALHVVKNLPLLFSRNELEEKVLPRLENNFIEQRLQESVQKLSSLEGIGQSRFIALDPLGLVEPVLGKMALLAPFPDAEIYKGFLLSVDRNHLLVTAHPKKSGTDTAFAREVSALLDSIARELRLQYTSKDIQITLTPVGSYRAALDNERIIRHDVNLALLLSMAGIGILLLIAFPRPLIGLFSLLPAFFGTALSLFVFSLLHPSISIMVLGFGGAIISITVDHGIAYLLFLDRPQKTKGKEASHEVLSVGVLAVLTTCGAFLTLSFSGFPVFVQLGQFTAMGMLFSFLFVHFVFPPLMPGMSASTRKNLPLQGIVDRLYNTGRWGAMFAVLLVSVLFFFARPVFHVSLESMNTVSQETANADSLFMAVWGNISNRVVLMLSANSISAMQQQNDQLFMRMAEDTRTGKIASAFNPSMIFPGAQLAQNNLAHWKEFWNAKRVTVLRHQLQINGKALGFSEHAFDAFLALLEPSYSPESGEFPARFQPLFGISEKEDQFRQFINVTPGENYRSQQFFERYQQSGKIFDSPYFSEKLADILFKSFTTMLAIIAASIVVLLFFFYASWQLACITLLPPLFSYICTLGTLKLIGHPLDIPGLMLSIVILGMGIDYSIHFVRAHQRYRNPDHQAFGLVRMAVFMAGASTIIGFGVLCFAEHSLLQSIGITSLLGIGYSLLGAFLVLPLLLRKFFSPTDSKKPGEQPIARRVRNRYRLMEAYPRMFARFKLQTDPMFTDLRELLKSRREQIRTILDIGCGYGVPGCWCLEYCKNAKLTGLDPDPERIRVAGFAMGDRGRVLESRASTLPSLSEPADLILVLDMLHYLDDESAKTLFIDCFSAISDKGILLIHYVSKPPGQKRSWAWKLEDFRVKLSGGVAYYRSPNAVAKFLTETGFCVEVNMVSKANSEMVWLLGRADK